MLGRSHHKLQKPEEFSRIYDICGVAMVSGSRSRGECTMPRFVVFFTVARHGLFCLVMLGDILFSTDDVSEALVVSYKNMGGPVMCEVVLGSYRYPLNKVIALHRFP